MKQVSNYPPVKYSVTKFGGGQTQAGVSYPGGLDQTTPSLALQPGALKSAQNFECAPSGGYARIAGYERLDGHAAPSAAAFIILQFAAFTNVPSLNDALSQATSGATATVIAVVTGPSPYVALTQVSGTFDTSHSVTDSTTSQTVGIPIPQTVAVSTKTQAIYLAAAADVYRALIGAVPGTGAMVDVFGLTVSGIDLVFALRANAGNTALALYKSSASGWTLVPFFNTVAFTVGGTATPADGETLTQGGVTATVKRVMQASGSWSGSTAAGQFVITNPAGGNFAAGAATLSGGAGVTLSGAQVAIAPLTGGKGAHCAANFAGQPQSKRIYGCDGVNPPYEFDGTIYAPIPIAGLSTNAPNHITAHRNYLFVAQRGSLLFSGPGLPFRWDAASGAGEIATGDSVAAMITVPGSQTVATLAVFNPNNTSFLYGLDLTTFNFVTFNNGSGALPYSAQNLYDTFVFDQLGVITLQTTLNWGNFLPSTLTRNILPFVVQEAPKLVASSVDRQKSQYRVFFSDGYGLYLTLINRQYLGSAPVFFPNPVSCIDYAFLSNNTTATYFGSSDGNGYVYQLDKGTSFDGTAISYFITLAWDALKGPRILKRFRALSLEIQGTAYAELSLGYNLDYGSARTAQPSLSTIAANFAQAPVWDSGFNWDNNFVWDGQILMPSDADLQGTAENIQIAISGNNNFVAQFTLDSAIYHYTDRRGMRV